MADQQLPSVDIVLDEARRKADFQFQQIDGLDTKSGIVLGINGVILALLVADLIEYPNQPHIILIEIVLIPILISLVLSFLSIATIKLFAPPKLDTLRSDYINKPANETKLKIIDILSEAISQNAKRIQVKTRLFNFSYIVLAFGIGLLLAWVGLILFK